MQLKSLELSGFKSFADKTTVTFQPGITAVVGPNGCGKSNISDAIRWVLGEQSARHLRGDKMEDVIFNGSESRKPLGMAEVSLRLTDVAGRLPSGFGEYSEIEITRRLYRSGESEYFINRIPCRLKDIRDLMMDAGVGAKIHAIIEQDRVDQILSSKPQDRRFLFEEVAGVMKYKARRQESLSKLESATQNQLRVNDIVTEVRRQLNSLDRQARKAERYQKLRAELKDLDFRLASVEYANLGREWAAATEEFRSVENELTELHARLNTIEAEIEENRADALAAEREVTVLRNRVRETENALSRAEHRVEMSRSQIASLTDQRGRDLADIAELRAGLTEASARKATVAEELRRISAERDEKNAVLRDRAASFNALAESLRAGEQALEEARRNVYSAVNESATERTRMSNLEVQLGRIDEEEARAQAEADELAARVAAVRELIAERERDLAGLTAKRDEAARQKEEVVRRIAASLEKEKALETELAALREKLATQTSRLRSLVELEQSLEGYQKGVRTVMSARKDAAARDRIGSVHGVVADIIETEPRYETAIEAVLGDRLQYVVVDSQTDSLKAIDYLKTKGGGRSTFVPRSPREIKSEPFVRNGTSGVIGPALDIVRVKDDYSDVAQYLLGDVVVVDTMETALHLWEHNGFHKTLVTLSGEIVDPWGAVTGGTPEAAGSGMLTKRREIKDLEQEIETLSKKNAAIEAALRTVEAGIETDRQSEAELSRTIHEAEIEIVHRQKDAAAAQEELARAVSRSAALDAEAAARRSKKIEVLKEIENTRALLHGLEQGRTSAEADMHALQQELAGRRAELETAQQGITELRMAAAALQEKQDGAARNLAAAEKAEADAIGRIAKREAELAAIAARLTELERSIAEAEREIADRMVVLDRERRDLAGREEAYREQTAALHSREEEAKRLHHEVEAVQKRLSANEVRRTELRMKIEHLKDAIWTTYHTALESVVTELGEFEINVDEARKRADELRQKIDQMGPINVDALQEYNELKERYDHLTAQQADITASIENLKKTIEKLDGETKDLFLEAYHAIQEKFKEVFTLLFEGGRAELQLLDETNILESGIEIVAQPRGKKLQSISLLSGGERALTAIALLFAAFLVKSSPFCLLDEVDAPLDEANVARFSRLLREMSSRSQFILITHNKRTMEIADALYGITMEEPGCSKIMSVRFREPALA